MKEKSLYFVRRPEQCCVCHFHIYLSKSSKFTSVTSNSHIYSDNLLRYPTILISIIKSKFSLKRFKISNSITFPSVCICLWRSNREKGWRRFGYTWFHVIRTNNVSWNNYQGCVQFEQSSISLLCRI